MSRKLTVTLILILFLLPIGSWYYLKSGLKWRQQAQAAMSGTQPMAGLPYQTSLGKRLDQEQVIDNVSLLTVLACQDEQSQRDLITSFYNQFKQTQKANFIFFDTCALLASHWVDSLQQRSYRIPCIDSLNACSTLFETWPSGTSYALVDRKGIIRSYYRAGTEDEKRTMLEHMALLIPREHGEKVELKRGQEK